MTALTRAELLAKYGSPEHTDEAFALRAIGRTDVPADWVYACVYPSREAAEAFAQANLEHHGHPGLGIASGSQGEGWIGVIDLRPALDRAMAEVRVRREHGH